jgi:hypothetical protein
MYYCDGDEEDFLPQPDCVCPGLFISDYETTQCLETLKKHNISHILNMKGGKELYPQVRPIRNFEQSIVTVV